MQTIADEVAERLERWIKHMGYDPSMMKDVNRALPDAEIPILLWDALNVIRDQQDDIRELHLK